MSMTDALDIEIRSLVTELIESAPLAPALLELESRGIGPGRPRDRRAYGFNRHSRRWPTAAAFGAGVTALVLVLLLLPTPALRSPSAAATALRHLARQAAAAEPPPVLEGDQWLQSEFRVSYLVAPTQSAPASAALRSARAVVLVDVEDWMNDLSQYCSQQVVSSVAYDSPASERAWSSSRSAVPSTQQPQCGSGFLGSDGLASGGLDVAQLPTDPAALAHAIESGTTGLSALDQPLPGNNYLTPFGRAVTLLVGPTLGGTPALWSALLRATATMPGVVLQGNEMTHTGTTGVALTGDTGEGHRTTVILSPSTGALLEARNLLVGQLLAGFPFGVLTTQWLDPIGIPRVVDANRLPSSLAGQVPTGIVSAVTDPGVTLSRWNAWLSSILPGIPGNPSDGAAATGTTGTYGVSVVTYTPDPDLARIRGQFRASGLVHTIRSATG
jgi:hypothetical protein